MICVILYFGLLCSKTIFNGAPLLNRDLVGNLVFCDGILIPAKTNPEFHDNSIDTPHDVRSTCFGTRSKKHFHFLPLFDLHFI